MVEINGKLFNVGKFHRFSTVSSDFTSTENLFVSCFHLISTSTLCFLTSSKNPIRTVGKISSSFSELIGKFSYRHKRKLCIAFLRLHKNQAQKSTRRSVGERNLSFVYLNMSRMHAISSDTTHVVIYYLNLLVNKAQKVHSTFHSFR